jgi:hypothetical protein
MVRQIQMSNSQDKGNRKLAIRLPKNPSSGLHGAWSTEHGAWRLLSVRPCSEAVLKVRFRNIITYYGHCRKSDVGGDKSIHLLEASGTTQLIEEDECAT